MQKALMPPLPFTINLKLPLAAVEPLRRLAEARQERASVIAREFVLEGLKRTNEEDFEAPPVPVA